MPKYKLMRIHIITAENQAAAWDWVYKATPDELSKKLDFQSLKEIEEPQGFVRTAIKQITGK